MLELTSVHHYFLRSFPMGKKNPFCNPWGHCCGWTNEIRCFYLDLSLEKVWHCLQQPIWTYNSLGSVLTQKNFWDLSLPNNYPIRPHPKKLTGFIPLTIPDYTSCKLLENCTHYSSRYLYGPYMVVPPPHTHRVFPAFIHMLITNIITASSFTHTLITKIITVKGLNPVHFFQAFFSQLLKLCL